MTRVSDNSNKAAMNFALNRAKESLENLQMKGTSLKRITKPSDDPVSNIAAMEITSSTKDNQQYLKNSNYALLQLNVTEKSLEQITDILTKAKELAIAQSSDFYNQDIRKSVANEVFQLRNQIVSISNKRIGNKYIFGGFSTLRPPFDQNGKYVGDEGKIKVEISKDFFVPINLHGREVFFDSSDETGFYNSTPPNIESNKNDSKKIENPSRDLASVNETGKNIQNNNNFVKRDNIFTQLSTLIAALENDDPKMVQNLLEKIDESISRVVTLRTRLGSIINSVESSTTVIESENVDLAQRKSKMIDADIAELFSDISKQNEVLKTTYKSSEAILNQSLLDFLR